jgi:hypothetical protein
VIPEVLNIFFTVFFDKPKSFPIEYEFFPFNAFSRIILISPLLIIRPSNKSIRHTSMVAVVTGWVNFRSALWVNYIPALTIRTDNGVIIKINGNPNYKFHSNYSKVNKDNKLVLGINYYIKNHEEETKILVSHLFCIEEYMDLKKKTNFYGIICRIKNSRYEDSM